LPGSSQSKATVLPLKHSNYQVLEAIMGKASFGSQNVPANTGSESTAPPLVQTHVAGHTVRIDTTALKQLIETLKAKLLLKK